MFLKGYSENLSRNFFIKRINAVYASTTYVLFLNITKGFSVKLNRNLQGKGFLKAILMKNYI